MIEGALGDNKRRQNTRATKKQATRDNLWALTAEAYGESRNPRFRGRFKEGNFRGTRGASDGKSRAREWSRRS